MTTCFAALGDDGIGSGALGGERLVERRRGGEPAYALLLEPTDELLRKETHDRGDHWRREFEERLALPGEIRRHCVACFGWHFRPPRGEEGAHSRFRFAVA